MAMEIKQSMDNLFRSKGFLGFLLGFIPFLVSGIFVFLTTKHGDVVLFVNRYSREAWDPIALFLTNFGLGSYAVALMILLLFVRIRIGLTGLISLAFSGIFTNVLKKVVFFERMRPFNYFYYDDFSRFIYSAELNYHFSFPSGHTMTAFSALSALAYFTGQKWLGALFFAFAMLVGFTRIYLLQHFFLDVYFGALLGGVCTILSILLLCGVLRLQRFAWLDKPIHRLRFK